MKQMYAPVWNGVAQALLDIFEGGHPADKVIQRQMKMNKKWGSSDRRLFAETVYDIVRWWRRLLFCMPDAAGFGDDMFRMAVSAWCTLQGVELGKGVRPSPVKLEELRKRWEDPPSRAVRESIPDWLDEWGQGELGERWEKLLPVLNSVAPVYLRANRLKTTPEKLVSRLASENFEAETTGGDGVRLKKRANVFLSKAFKEGLFEMQDLSSQQVALAVDPKAGERVVDGCAGAGGKTLHMAALMRNKGRIVALDVHEKRLEALRERSSRAGATIVEVKMIDSNKVIKRLHESADRVLLDVPCSGLGVLRRNPDAKYRLTEEEVERVKGLQKEILGSYSQMCKPGGRLVYSTCSIMPSENERQIEWFLERNQGWRMVSQKTLLPEAGGPDGFFISILERS